MLYKRFIQAVMMPAFVVSIQLFFRFLLGKEIFGVGISLSAVALAQIFPYLFFDNLILLKVYSLSTKFEEENSELLTRHTFTIKKKSSQILELRNLTIFLFIVILALFIVTLGLGYKDGYSEYHNYTGALCVILSIGYLIFA